MSITEIANYQPQRLGAEPWGSRLTRAREAAGFTVRGAAEAIGQFSHATVARIESYDQAPGPKGVRQRATMLVVLYGFDPADFGLDPEDVPPVIDLRTVRDLGRASTKWNTFDPTRHLMAS